MRALAVLLVLCGCRVAFDPHGDAASDDLLAHWTFDEGAGGRASDLVAGRPLILVGGVTWTAGRAGTALDFDGIDATAIGDSQPALDNLTAFTFTAWIRPRTDGLAGFGVILAKAGSGPAAIKRWLLNAGGACATGHCLEANVNRATLDGGALSLPGAIAISTWQFVAATYDSTGAHLYRDATELTYASPPIAGSGTFVDDSATPYAVGAWPVANSSGVFDGAIDEVQIFRRALTPSELLAIAQSI